MKRLRNIVLIIFSSLLMIYCSSSKEAGRDEGKDEVKEVEVYNPSIDLNVDNVTSWIAENLAKERKFYVSGDVIVPESDDYDLQNIELQKVNIYQQNELFYSVFPTVQLKNHDDSMKEFLFSTISGMEMNPMFNYDRGFTVEIIFGEDGDYFSYRVENKVQKVQ